MQYCSKVTSKKLAKEEKEKNWQKKKRQKTGKRGKDKKLAKEEKTKNWQKKKRKKLAKKKRKRVATRLLRNLFLLRPL